ncbi:TrmH family RNA methyltransferase [Haloimpatiens sp. FM7315]|uniref:TrmH family RNA methyltransferase n=1 Tax=Haloimpatiens sp. FM7315 TaxID=3298609 RepID=UPI003709CF3A
METIKSKDNLIIKNVKKLKEKKYRIQDKCFLVEGFRFVLEAIKSKFKVKYIFVCNKTEEKWQEFSKDILLKDVDIFAVSEQILKSISSTNNPQGVVAVVENCDNVIDKDIKDGIYILVDKVQDPGNLGTIIRTAHAVGALGVILTKGTVDLYNDKTLRSTMGSIFHIPIVEDEDFSVIDKLKKQGFKLIASYLDNESVDFYSLNLKGKFILAVGNEGNGIGRDVIKLSDIKAKIPMPGGSESLNVSVAASVMMYEALRQKFN